MKLEIYLAAPLSEAQQMRVLASRLERAEMTIVSQWHDTVDTIDPPSKARRHAILYSNLDDVERADVVLVDTRAGVPGATLCEVGYALAIDTPVVWLQHEEAPIDGVKRTNIFDAHLLVTVVHDEVSAVDAIRAAVGAR